MGSVPVTSSVGFWLFCSSRAASLNQQCHHGIIPAPWAQAWCSYMEEQLEPPIAVFCTPTEMQVCVQQAGGKDPALGSFAHSFLRPHSWMGQSQVTP